MGIIHKEPKYKIILAIVAIGFLKKKLRTINCLYVWYRAFNIGYNISNLNLVKFFEVLAKETERQDKF